MQLADANVVLRYLLDDNEQSKEAKRIIETGEVGITTEALVEVVYVLKKVYQVPRVEINSILVDFITDSGIIVPEEDVFIKALEFFSKDNEDIVDCLLAAHAFVSGATIHTFDKDLKKLIKRL